MKLTGEVKEALAMIGTLFVVALVFFAIGKGSTEYAVIRDCNRLGKTVIRDRIYHCIPVELELQQAPAALSWKTSNEVSSNGYNK